MCLDTYLFNNNLISLSTRQIIPYKDETKAHLVIHPSGSQHMCSCTGDSVGMI